MIPIAKVIVSPTEPTGKNRKKVWMQNTDEDKKIYIKNSNDVYEELINKEKAHDFYSGYESNDQTFDTTYTKINNLELNINTSGGDIICTISLLAKLSASGTGSAYIYLDGTRIGRILTINGTSAIMYSGHYILKNVSRGPHTISVYARSDNSAYSLIIPKHVGKSFSVIEL